MPGSIVRDFLEDILLPEISRSDGAVAELIENFVARPERTRITKLFLTFLKPIINGVGNYYIEAQTRDQKRTDIFVDYHGRQYIIETKVWHGEEYQAKGRKQLCDYPDIYHQTTGWLVSFCLIVTKI